MIVDVYDLSGALCYSRYKINCELCSYELMQRKRISDVLISPGGSGVRNQPPYIQDRYNPIIRDFIDEKGGMSYQCCSYLGDFFQSEHFDEKKITDFFRALRFSPYVNREKEADRNIILVPDNFDAVIQEKILRNCALPRKTTELLWRSVAACLGNAEQLKANGTAERKIAVVDAQQKYLDISVLNLLFEDGEPVPQRKAYKSKSASYPCHESYNGERIYQPYNSFYRHTFYGKSGEFVVWNTDNDDFIKQTFKQKEKQAFKQHIGTAENTIIIGATSPFLFIQSDKKGHSISDGAALYVARNESGRPTYYDECTGLYIIVQNNEKLEIIAKELIPPNDKCKGGKTIRGTVNEDCFITEGSDNLDFYLADEQGNDVQLKKLEYHLKNGGVTRREPVKLYPSMIPGQGIAKVLVTGTSQLKDTVELDLLKMTATAETVSTLQEKIKWPYPIELPGVVANGDSWDTVVVDVERYMRNAAYRNKDMFNKLCYVDQKAKGLDRFRRKNVFGYAPGQELPNRRFNFKRLFQYMADDYTACKRRGYADDIDAIVSMISRTYQGNFKGFQRIKKDILDEVIACSYGVINAISSHKMTACAYLLRGSELKIYFEAYVRMAERNRDSFYTTTTIRRIANGAAAIIIPDISGLNHWNRVLYELLIANGDMLKNVSTTLCCTCIDNLALMLLSHHIHNKPNLAYSVLKVCLCMLTKRKHDKSFLNDGSQTRKHLEMVLKTVKNTTSDEKQRAWAQIIMDYLEGNGTLTELMKLL